MNFTATLFFGLSFFFCFSQNQHTGLVLDQETNEPLEFVGVYNDKDYTVSNSDGRFAFTSTKDSLIFYRVGYDKLQSTFPKLKDTIFLNKSVLELNEVVVTNEKTIWQKFADSVRTNYRIETYKEKFFLRCVLRRNDTIVRIQDMEGKLKRKTLFYPETMEQNKKDFAVELTNMRKIGINTDKNDTYFIFPSYYETLKEFVRINATGKGFELEEFQFDERKMSRLNFTSIPSEKVKSIQGHYIINNIDNAMLSFELNIAWDGAKFTKNRWLRYRTLQKNVKIFFEKAPVIGDYFLKSAKNYLVVEALDKENTFRNVFTIEILLTSFHNFGNFDVKSNINEHKDMFKLKFPYNPEYWNSQNQLLLTNEMQEFIKTMGEYNKEFKVKSNMN